MMTCIRVVSMNLKIEVAYRRGPDKGGYLGFKACPYSEFMQTSGCKTIVCPSFYSSAPMS